MYSSVSCINLSIITSFLYPQVDGTGKVLLEGVIIRCVLWFKIVLFLFKQNVLFNSTKNVKYDPLTKKKLIVYSNI